MLFMKLSKKNLKNRFHRAIFEAVFTPCIEIGWRLKKEAWGK